MSSSRKKTFRFSMKDDIDLLKEVTAVNPFSGVSANKWAEVAENFMVANEELFLDGKRCRERTTLLICYFKAEDRNLLYRSAAGTDEEYGEREQLLQEVADLSEQVKFNKIDKGKEESEKGKLIRKRAIENLKTATSDNENLNDTPSLGMKKRKSNTVSQIDFLNRKTETEHSLSKEKIELEKKKLELEEKKQQRGSNKKKRKDLP